MPTYHIDLVNGNDANTGADWANAWKTVTNGATAARIAPGDTIKISKTGDATSLAQNASWTSGSQTVTLTTAVNKHIAQAVGNTWTVSANVTGASNANRKFGATAQSLAIAAGFTTGKVAYVAIDGGGTQDFSAYQKISFWIYNSAAIAASTLSIRLCSDAIGDVTVDTLAIPAIATSGSYVCIEIDKGSALGASIQSVALYADLDPGTLTVYLNNIVAGNTLTHRTLIGKNDGQWWPVQSIDNTTIKIDEAINYTASGRGYYGTTESATIYYRTTFALLTATTGSNMSLDSGSQAGGNIIFSGGWNTGTNLQDGHTWFDGLCYLGTGIAFSTYVQLIKISAVRYNLGFQNQNSIATFNMDECNAVCCQIGWSYASIGNGYHSNSNLLCNIRGMAVAPNNPLQYSLLNCKAYSNAFYGFTLGIGTNLYDCEAQNNGSTSAYANNPGTYNEYAARMRHTILGDATELTWQTSNADQYVWSFDHDNTTDNNWGFTSAGTVNWQTAVFQGADPGAWKLTISSSVRTTLMPLRVMLAEIGIEAGSNVTFTCWCKKDHATNVGAKIYVKSGDESLDGVVYTEDVKANDTNWEQLSITFQSTQDGVVEIWGEGWYVAGNSNVYFGSIEATQ